MVDTHKDKHEFACFVESLSSIVMHTLPGGVVVIIDEKLVHRLITVLRLKKDDQCILFDRSLFAVMTVVGCSGKKQIQFLLQSKHTTVAQQKKITFLLPVLKRDDSESALYALAEMGVNTIQLVFTQKSAHQWNGHKDYERAQRIIIAAAEQSKNFAYPELKEPISLEAALQLYSTGHHVFFDATGKALFDVAQHLRAQTGDITLLIGPEGDLSLEEKRMVQVKGFIFCALTPTIVRAFQAATLGAGLIRSLLV